MERGMSIIDEDVRAVVRLLGRIAGMTEPLAERRRELITGLARLIDADVWLWVHSAGWNDKRPGPLALIDGGWLDEAERNRVHHANSGDEVTQNLSLALRPDRPVTFLYDATHPGWNGGDLFERIVRPSGLEHLLFSIHPLPEGMASGIGLHRRAGRPAYTPRETALVHLVLGQVDWLHELTPPPVVREGSLSRLTPREREVLVHLLGGDGKQQIAAKLGLSVHTVGDYLKSIYKRLGVNTRGELMAKFLPAPPGGAK